MADAIEKADDSGYREFTTEEYLTSPVTYLQTVPEGGTWSTEYGHQLPSGSMCWCATTPGLPSAQMQRRVWTGPATAIGETT